MPEIERYVIYRDVIGGRVGEWTLLLDPRAAIVPGRECVELVRHSNYLAQLAAKDEEIERLKARYTATREELLANWRKAEAERDQARKDHETALEDRDGTRKQRDEELRERLRTAAMKDKMFEEAVKHLSFDSPEHQEEYVWGLVDGVAQTIADSLFKEGDDD